MGWEEDDADHLIFAIAEEANDNLDAVVEGVLRAVVRGVPSYAEARRPGDLGDFRSGLRRGIELCLACIVDGRLPDGDELHALWLIGAQRARQGIPAQDLETVLDIARREVLDVLLSRAEVADFAAAAVLEAARRLAARLDQFTDTVAVSVLDGHSHGLEEWFPAGSRQRAVLVDRLLEGRWTSEDDLAEDARAVGRVLGPRTGLLLVLPFEKLDHDSLLRATEAVAAVIGDGIEGALRWTPVAHIPVIASVGTEAEWAGLLQAVDDTARAHGIGVVMIDPTPAVAEIAKTYHHAARGLGRATAARRGPGVIPLRRLELLRVLSGDATVSDRMAFVRRVIGPILALPDADAVLEILDACHLGTGRVADVARTVHRHENTVRKRLDRVHALTGLSVHVPAERYEIETAVHLHRLLVHELSTLDHRDV